LYEFGATKLSPFGLGAARLLHFRGRIEMARSLPVQRRHIEHLLSFCRENEMAKQVITAGGEDHLVREDTAKSFRGVHWALLSLAAFLVITAILFFGGFLTSLTTKGVESPAQIERQAGR
jgi:hypothetical protein